MIFIILRQRCRLAAQAIAFKEQHGTTGKTIRGNKMNQSLTEYKKNLEWGLQESVNGCIFQSSPIALTHIYIYIWKQGLFTGTTGGEPERAVLHFGQPKRKGHPARGLKRSRNGVNGTSNGTRKASRWVSVQHPTL